MPQQFMLVDRKGNSISLDGGEYLVTMTRGHHEVHAGKHYTFQDIDEDVDILGPKEWLFVTPDTTKRFHFLFSLSASGGGIIRFLEGVTTSADGTARTAMNNNRNSANTSDMLCYYDPTITDDGTLFCPTTIGSDSNQGSGGDSRRESEVILAQDTKYAIRFTPYANSTVVSICANWYEV